MIEDIKKLKKYNSIPENLRLLLNWYAWLEYDKENNIESDDYYDYSNFRYWCLNELTEWHDLDESIIPKINSEADFLNTWFYLFSKLDFQSLLDVNLSIEYKIHKTYQGIGLHPVN